jgi:hypothetical protein
MKQDKDKLNEIWRIMKFTWELFGQFKNIFVIIKTIINGKQPLP